MLSILLILQSPKATFFYLGEESEHTLEQTIFCAFPSGSWLLFKVRAKKPSGSLTLFYDCLHREFFPPNDCFLG